MDVPAPQKAPFGIEDPVAGTGAQAQWREILQAVSSMPDQASERWLGQLVLEVQGASDRAVAAARVQADALIADARAEAIAIREAGRRRARAITQLRAAMREAVVGAPAPLAGVAPVVAAPLPPAPRGRVGRPAAPAVPGAAGASAVVGRVGWPAAPGAPGAAGAAAVVAPVAAVLRARVGRPAAPGAAGAAGAPGGAAVVAAEAPAMVAPSEKRPPPPAAAPVKPRAARTGLQPVPVLVALAVVAAALGLVVLERYGTASHERGSQDHLAAQFAELQAKRGAQDWPVAGKAFAFLDVPRVDIDEQAVVEEATLADLRRGPAHESSSELPGQPGAVVILGRRQTYGGPFARLGDLRVGDVITLRTPGALFVYRVSRPPQVLSPGPGATLQLPSPAQVVASGGPAGGADQALVLATSRSSRGRSLEVVVATLDQASTANPGSRPASGNLVAQLRSVPGQPIGMALFVVWLLVALGAVDLVRRVGPRLPPAVVYGATSVVVLVAVYHMYLAIDRLVPGTY